MEISAYFDQIRQGTERLEDVKISPEVNRELEKKKLKEKCYEFEALLFNSMLRSMRKTIEKSGLISGGDAEEIYTSLLDQEYAIILSKNSRTNIADALYEQLTQKQMPKDLKSQKNIEGVFKIK